MDMDQQQYQQEEEHSVFRNNNGSVPAVMATVGGCGGDNNDTFHGQFRQDRTHNNNSNNNDDDKNPQPDSNSNDDDDDDDPNAKINVMIPDGDILTNELLKEQSSTSSPSSTNNNNNNNSDVSKDLEVGDHVYQWRKLGPIPYVFQHHGIVMDIQRKNEDGSGEVTKLVIADFSNVETTTTANNNKKKSENSKKNETTKRDDTADVSCSSSGSDASNNIDQQERDTKEELNRQSATSNAGTEQSQSTRTTTDAATTTTATTSTRTLSLVQEGVFRTYTDTDTWHKVEYGSSWINRQLSRSGTVTKAQASPVGLVLARVHFILEHPELLPDYHVIHANCECVAFWCRTGIWSSLQGSTFLELTTAGQVKSSVTLAATAATTQASVTVPSAGLWGWFGYTTTSQVSWLSLHPMAVPGLACYAALTIGVPAIYYASAHKAWKKTTDMLNDEFWKTALDRPEVFAECLTHWSDKNS